MSRPLPSAFRPTPVQPFSVAQPIRTGSDTGAYGELDQVENLHFVHANARSPIVQTVFSSDDSATGGLQPYVHGQASATIEALWVVPVLAAPWSSWRVYILVENTSGTHAATVRFNLASDPTTYVLNVSVPASSAAWTELDGALAINVSAGALDTIRMLPINGATGTVRVHSVMICPEALSAIAAGAVERAGLAFIPSDSAEFDGSSALSVAVRRRVLDGAEFVRRTVADGEVIVAWSDNFGAPSDTFYTVSSDYQLVIRVPFRTGPDHSAVRWGLAGYIRLVGGKARLLTRTMIERGTAAVEVDLGTTWASDYAADTTTYQDTGQVALETRASIDDELFVEIKKGSLMSFSAWLAR